MSVNDTRSLRADRDALNQIAEYRAARERGEWRRLILPSADLRDSDLSGLDLDESDLSGAVLDGVRFVGASLVRSNLAGSSLLGADLSYASLDRADLEAADATAASFAGASLRRANLAGCRLHRADLSDADLTQANLYDADLTAADLSGAVTDRVALHGAILEDTLLTGVRGEPRFADLPGRPSSATPAVWAAARLGEPQLAELAGLYLNSMGWGVIEHAGRHDEGVDLMAQRDDVTAVVQVKATATLSSLVFTHLVQRMKRVTQGRPRVLLILVMPGPVPDTIRNLALQNHIGVLSVRVSEHTMRVEEVVGPGTDQLAAPGASGRPLTALAGQTVAAAATTDAWELTQPKLARLLGRGDVRRTNVAERWLAQTREQLTATATTSIWLNWAWQAQVWRWADRFADLLDEDPSVEAELRSLVEEVAAGVPSQLRYSISGTSTSIDIRGAATFEVGTSNEPPEDHPRPGRARE